MHSANTKQKALAETTNHSHSRNWDFVAVGGIWCFMPKHQIQHIYQTLIHDTTLIH